MKLNSARNLVERIQSGEKAYGGEIGPACDPKQTVTALKEFGYDFFIVDLEHSLVNKETMFEYIRASRSVDIPILIRPEDSRSHFRAYLDSGVNGLMVGLTDTVEDVKHVIDESYYKPIGNRGMSLGMSPFLIDFQDYDNTPLLDLLQYVNNNTLIFPMTESLECIENLHQILGLQWVTGTIVGCSDLALDIGYDAKTPMIPGITTSKVDEKVRQILKICKDTGKVAGIGAQPIERLREWEKEGYELFVLAYIIDGDLDSLRSAIDEMKSS